MHVTTNVILGHTRSHGACPRGRPSVGAGWQIALGVANCPSKEMALASSRGQGIGQVVSVPWLFSGHLAEGSNAAPNPQNINSWSGNRHPVGRPVYAWRAPFIGVCNRRVAAVASPRCIMIPLFFS